MNRNILHYLAIVFIILSIIMSGISLLPKNDWAQFKRTSGIASIDYTLSADFDALGFEYHIVTESSGSGGLIGGVGGGLGGNTSLGDDWKTYPEVRGEVLENLGVLYDSYKLKSFEYELLMKEIPQDEDITWDGSGSPSAILNVSLKANLVPYWPEDSERPLIVEITYLGSEIDDQLSPGQLDRIMVTLNRITIVARTGYDPTTGEYEGEDIELKEIEITETFNKAGEYFKTEVNVKIPDGQEAVGFVVEIDAELEDPWGRSVRAPLAGKANPINIRPVSQRNVVRGAGIALGFPVTMIGLILGIIGAIMIFVKKRAFIGLLIPAGILTITGPVWFRSGMTAAVDMLSQRLSDAQSGLEWTGGYYFGIAGGILMLIAMVICIVSYVLMKLGPGDEKERTPNQEVQKGPVFKTIDEETEPVREVPTPVSTFKKVEEKVEVPAPPPPPKNPLE
jgi:hypothetical protein